MVIPSAGKASPMKFWSLPDMIRSSVLFPDPFRPSTPIFAPGRNDSQISLRTTWSGW